MGGPEELLSSEEKEMYACKVWGLQARLALEKERSDLTKTTQLDLKGRVMTLQEDLRREKENLYSITADLNNQNRQLQDRYSKEIDSLNQKNDELKQVIQEKDEHLRDVVKGHETVLNKKDDENRELRRKMDEMSAEFARMMKVWSTGNSRKNERKDRNRPLGKRGRQVSERHINLKRTRPRTVTREGREKVRGLGFGVWGLGLGFRG